MEFQHQKFSQLLKTLFQNNLYEKAIQQASRKYKIKHYRIEKLKPSGIKTLLKKNSQKQKTITLEDNNYAWAQGQLKIFVWLLVGYAYVKKIDINDMNLPDFQLFSQIFEGYSLDFLNYQAKFLVRRPQKVLWTEQQAKLLNEIIKVKFQQKNWNTVAYELYMNSDKTVFRTPKQCRERWLNHQDPVKNHSQWTVQQDIELLRFVKSMGKKWSSISKSMKSTRTEHMVKNRFTSLIKKASKANKYATEKQLIDILVKLKKVKRVEQEKSCMDQEMPIQPIVETQPQIQIELKEIQNPYEQIDCKKQIQRESEYFAPINLIPEAEEDEGPQTEQVIPEYVMNFFQQDDAYSVDHTDYFFTVPEPTKQL